MAPPITTLRIQGFKSLVDVQLQPRQLNLFIGRPNTGKSNILEALSLLGAGYGAVNGRPFMEGMIRLEKPRQLFYDNQPANEIQVETNQWKAWLGKLSTGHNGYDIGMITGPTELVDYVKQWGEARNEFAVQGIPPVKFFLENIGDRQTPAGMLLEVSTLTGFLQSNQQGFTPSGNTTSFVESRVRRYSFGAAAHTFFGTDYLKPPGGDNLYDVVLGNRKLQQSIAALFEGSGLQFVLRDEERRFELQKNENGVVKSYPYSSIADTFQRLIFYLAAIESNEGAVLLLEEPEAHAFPPFTNQLATRIAEDAEAGRNQYFISTHSPYLFNRLIENTAADQLGVFVVYYEDYQTKVRQLTDEQVAQVLDYGTDVFYNLDALIHPDDVR